MLADSDRSPSILVIDDNGPELVAMEALLQPLGYRVLLAEDAEAGMAHAARDDVALILTDVRMPGLDGLEMLARLRRRASGRGVPVVFLSGFGYDSAQAHRAYELGALDYIVKPVDPDILRAKVRALVTIFEQAREIERRGRAITDRERETKEARHLAASAIARTAVAEETIRQKDRYMGVLGHDLRNPLFAILAGLHTLARSPSQGEQDRARIIRMRRSAERMRDMIGALLDYARTSADEFPHNPVATDFRQICEAPLDELRSSHPDRAIVLETRGDVSGIWDRGRLEQVVSNLVTNALEHSSGVVSVRVQDAGDEVILAVHNDGDPIPPDVVPALFEPFHRGDDKPSGLGLGLYIVREVVRSHGGAIEVSSSVETGTTFVSRWPRRAARTDFDPSQSAVATS